MTASQATPIEPAADSPRAGTKGSRINLRVTSRQEHLIRRAAAVTDRSLTDFVLDSAARRAEEVLADRRWFVLPDADWESFERVLEAPLEHASDLRDLLVERREIDFSDL